MENNTNQTTASDANSNPLQQFFRPIGMHVRLPSGGVYTKPGSLDTTMNGEIPVYAMTKADEYRLKNPDSLLNGYAIEQLILSCVPSIKDVRNLTSQDVDILLLAIRASTYGNMMTVDVSCPVCQKEQKFEASIPSLMGTIKTVDFEYSVRLTDDLVVYVMPYTYESITIDAISKFEEAQLYKHVMDTDDIDASEKSRRFTESFEKIVDLNLDLMSKSITKIVIPNQEVKDPKYIREFVQNAPKGYIEAIEKKVMEINSLGLDKKQKVTCSEEECKHEWESEIIFDPSYFFDFGS